MLHLRFSGLSRRTRRTRPPDGAARQAQVGQFLSARRVPQLGELVVGGAPLLQHLRALATGSGGQAAALAAVLGMAGGVLRNAPGVWAAVARHVQGWRQHP